MKELDEILQSLTIIVVNNESDIGEKGKYIELINKEEIKQQIIKWAIEKAPKIDICAFDSQDICHACNDTCRGELCLVFDKAIEEYKENLQE